MKAKRQRDETPEQTTKESKKRPVGLDQKPMEESPLERIFSFHYGVPIRFFDRVQLANALASSLTKENSNKLV